MWVKQDKCLSFFFWAEYKTNALNLLKLGKRMYKYMKSTMIPFQSVEGVTNANNDGCLGLELVKAIKLYSTSLIYEKLIKQIIIYNLVVYKHFF